MITKIPTHNMATTETTIFSGSVKHMLGFSLHTWEDLMLWSLGAAALAAVFIIVSTYAVVRLQRREAVDAKRDLDAYKVEAGEKIAMANSIAETAKADTARANETIAELQANTAEANARALEAQAALEKYKAPRVITPAQQISLVDALKAFAGQEYGLSVAAGAEAENLLCSLDAILQSAGWSKVPPFGDVEISTNCGPVGFNTVSSVHVRASTMAPEAQFSAALTLATKLREAGIGAVMERDPKNIPNAIAINVMVGIKP